MSMRAGGPSITARYQGNRRGYLSVAIDIVMATSPESLKDAILNDLDH
jgi:hypothetical protein